MLVPADFQVNEKYFSKYPAGPFEEKEFDITLPQKKLNAFTKELDIETLDLLPVLRESMMKKSDIDLYFPEKDPHFTAAGHQKTAEILYQKLKSQKFQKNP